MKTVYELLNELNEAIKSLYGIKIKDWGTDLHDKMMNIVTPLLPKYLNIWSWGIQYLDEENLFDNPLHRIDIFFYKIDFTEDKRSTYRRYGKLNKIWFVQCDDIDINLPIDEYFYELKIKILKGKLEKIKMQFTELNENYRKQVDANIEYSNKISKQIEDAKNIYSDTATYNN